VRSVAMNQGGMGICIMGQCENRRFLMSQDVVRRFMLMKISSNPDQIVNSELRLKK
jgi:hypothetical protein